MASGLDARCRQLTCRTATVEELSAVHDPILVREVAKRAAAAGPEGISDFDMSYSSASNADACIGRPYLLDCYMSQHTYDCARLAAGGIHTALPQGLRLLFAV